MFFKRLPHISVLTGLFLAPRQQGDRGRHSCVCRRQIWARLQGSCPKPKCCIWSNLRDYNNSPRFSTPQIYSLPHHLMSGLRSGQLLLVDGHLLPQRQARRCDGVHFLQGGESGERKTRSAVVQHCIVESVASFFRAASTSTSTCFPEQQGDTAMQRKGRGGGG